jgi:tetratricopeptide (TPR) repeat protein
MSTPILFRHLRSANPIERRDRRLVMARHLAGFPVYAAFIALLLLPIPAKASLLSDDYDSVLDEANQNFQKGAYAKALTLYGKANGMKNKKSPECLWGMAQAYSKLGRYQEILETCDRLIQASGTELAFQAKAWNLRGNTLYAGATQDRQKLDKKALSEAEKSFREVLRISPGLSMAYYNLGLTMIWLDRVDEGKAALQAYIKNADDRKTAEKAVKIIENPLRAVYPYVPDFSMLTSDGSYLSSDELKGKVCLIQFWNSKITQFQNTIPYLRKLNNKYKKNDDFFLIGVNFSDPEAEWRAFISENKLNWSQARDINGKMYSAFNVQWTPYFYLLDPEGMIIARGTEPSSAIERQIDQALKAAVEYKLQPKRAGISPSSIELSSARPQGLSGTSTPPDVATATIPFRNADVRREYAIKIPKPVIKVEQVNSNLASAPTPNQYYVKIVNRASIPDDLFMSIRNLAPCSADPTGAVPDDGVSARIEITVWSEEGRRLKTVCGAPTRDHIGSIYLYISPDWNITKIYTVIKDRLTGNFVQSDSAALP